MESRTFYPFYKGRITEMINRIWEAADPAKVTGSGFRMALAAVLYERMHRLCVRTLIAGMHGCLEKGRVKRSNPEEEYLEFMQLLEEEAFRKEILESYPGLSELLERQERNQYQFWTEFLIRLKEDWHTICNEFGHGGEGLRVTSLKVEAADLHCGGKSVVRVETNGKLRFFYKPHGAGNEIFLQSLLDQICAAQGWESRQYRIIDRETYGWEEEILPLPCDSEEAVRSFQRKAGMLAAVSYVLGIGDLHYENIIANGDQPVIVDAEAMFQHMDPLYQGKEGEAAFYSVLTSGLFPGGTAGKNVSGIMGGGEWQYEREVPTVLHERTSEMRIGYEKPRMKKGKNRAVYRGEHIDSSRYINDILHGFEVTYRWFLENREWVMAMIRNHADSLYSRYISGGTQFFSMGIFASTHPQLLTGSEGRADYLDRILKNRPLGIWEKQAMLEGDIPWFCRRLTDRNLYTGAAIVCDSFFRRTLIEELEERLGQLSTEDQLLQQMTVRTSLTLFAKEGKWINSVREKITETKNAELSSVKGKQEDLGRYAKRIADEILGYALRRKDKLFWLSVDVVGRQTVIRPMDIYFYSGIAGIAVFFRKLCTIDPSYEETAAILERQLRAYTDQISRGKSMPDTLYTGMYCGESSVAYAWQLLYQITRDEKFLLYAGGHLRSLSGALEKDERFDLLYGNAGLVLVLCRQYEATNDPFYLKEAMRALAVLEKGRTETEQGVVWKGEGGANAVCSMAHGNSGILLAYARLNSIAPSAKLTERMKQIVSYENQFYDERTGNWADLRKEGEEKFHTYAWCSGGLGVLYARMQAAKWNPREKWLRKEVEKIIPLSRQVRFRDGMCLCHGNTGNFLMMREIHRYLGDTEMEAVLMKYQDKIVGELEKGFDSLLPQERYNAGVMNGLGGMGVAALHEMR